MTDYRSCHIHKNQIPNGPDAWCPDCLANWTNRKSAARMTPEARAAEVRWWFSKEGGGILEIPFSNIQERMEELVGRPVWTHEFGSGNEDRLANEALGGKHATMSDIIDQLAQHGKPVIIVNANETSR